MIKPSFDWSTITYDPIGSSSGGFRFDSISSFGHPTADDGQLLESNFRFRKHREWDCTSDFSRNSRICFAISNDILTANFTITAALRVAPPSLVLRVKSSTPL